MKLNRETINGNDDEVIWIEWHSPYSLFVRQGAGYLVKRNYAKYDRTSAEVEIKGILPLPRRLLMIVQI